MLEFLIHVLFTNVPAQICLIGLVMIYITYISFDKE